MKSVQLLVKLRRLVKSLAVSLFIIVIGTAGSAFTSDTEGDKKPAKDSLQNGKTAFISFFGGENLDPANRYTTTQLNPKAISFVQEYIKKNGKELQQMKIWGKSHFDMYDNILSQYGLPLELKYLSVIESHLSAKLVSTAGARGPWQIMPDEAIRFGLKMKGKTDERSNFYKSTHVAAKLLKELHSQFNDWLLVVGAYNCGAGRMKQAIRKSGSSNFWDLQQFLPLETRNHVKKFIGTHYIFEGNGGLTTQTAAEIREIKDNIVAMQQSFPHQNNNSAPEDMTQTTTMEVSGKYTASVIANAIGMDFNKFNKLNPDFDKLLAMGNNYFLRLPADKMTTFLNQKNRILQESIQARLKG